MVKCSVPGCNNPATEEVNGTPLCKQHAKILKKGTKKSEALRTQLIHPVLRFPRDPLSVLITKAIGFREAEIPFSIPVTKNESHEGNEVSDEEVDWYTIVGAEPIDELKGNIDLVLAAEFCERNDVVTSSMLATYLTENPYSRRDKYTEDNAREILNQLAKMKIVKKESKSGERGQNLYIYHEGEKSWRKGLE